MRGTLLAMLTLVAAGGAWPAHADPADLADPQGRKCRFNSVTDVLAEAGHQTGEADGGPLVVLGVGAVPVTCTVFVNGTPATSVSGSPVAAGTIRYDAGAADSVSLCTSVTYGGRTRYWHGDGWEDSAGWGCYATWESPNNSPCPVWLTVDKYAGTPLADTWQDCEPYEPLL